jgi:hypothetical protein
LNFINKSNATARYLSCGVFAFTNYMGKLRSPLKEMLRALPLKPTKGSAFGNRKLLKKLEQNF